MSVSALSTRYGLMRSTSEDRGFVDVEVAIEGPAAARASGGDADYDAMDCGDAAGVVAPPKGAMRECDGAAEFPESSPQDAQLFALGEGVG